MHVDAVAHGDEAALRDKAPVADCRGEGDALEDLRDVALRLTLPEKLDDSQAETDTERERAPVTESNGESVADAHADATRVQLPLAVSLDDEPSDCDCDGDEVGEETTLFEDAALALGAGEAVT